MSIGPVGLVILLFAMTFTLGLKVNRGESLPSSDGFPSLPLSLDVSVIRADLQ